MKSSEIPGRADRTETRHNKIVGVTDRGEVYVLEQTFQYRGDFRGATGKILMPITQAEYDERTTKEGIEEYLEEIWQMVVADGGTTLGLEEWCDHAISVDGEDHCLFNDIEYDENLCDEARFYLSMLPNFEGEEIWGFEDIGGGRIFKTFDEMQGQFELMPNTELWFEINEYERSKDDGSLLLYVDTPDNERDA